MNNTKKIEDKNTGMNPIVAAVTGVVVGAGIVAGAVAMQDKNTRTKVSDALTKIKDKAGDIIEDTQAKVSFEKEKLDQKVEKMADKKDEA